MVACSASSGTRAYLFYVLRCKPRCLHPLHTLASARLFILISYGFYEVRNTRPGASLLGRIERCNQIVCSMRKGKSLAAARRIRRLMQHGSLIKNYPPLSKHNEVM